MSGWLILVPIVVVLELLASFMRSGFPFFVFGTAVQSCDWAG